MARLLLIICLLGLSLNALAHKFYTGITDIQFNPNTNSLEIIHRFATHDFERHLTTLNDKRISADDKKVFEAALKQYFNQHFSVASVHTKANTSNDVTQLLPIQWIGVEPGIHETYIYQEVPGYKLNGKLLISNSVLMDYAHQQVNTVNLQLTQHKLAKAFTFQSHKQAMP
ncbi:DUF6702 family protein [Flocculibacter collagenilyticus]|uniref:DUF6702 family protein n=1 Tax=Flocculibacter collagenilyticus TaxID=2744479 RepID=UPI0018F6A950|nr:DUF6702 family protein [Flocculibacter collagenilyticus]